MTNDRFDLVDVFHIIRRRIRFIIIVTFLAAIVGAVFYMTKTKRFEAKNEFLVANPLYGDRNNIFRMSEPRFVDYMAGDDDLDKCYVIANSDTLADIVISELHLAEAYGYDLNDPKKVAALKGYFKKNLDVKHTEYKDLILSYTDTDPKRAADVANMAVKKTEEIYRGYYNRMRADVCQSMQVKIGQMDTAIDSLTDTLAALRNQYNIYDIISPARANLMVSDVKAGNGSGMGIEKIQNIEAIKDQLVADRAKYNSLLNEFSFGNKANELSLIQVISKADAPVAPKGPRGVMTVVACALLGFFFSICIVLLINFYQYLASTEQK